MTDRGGAPEPDVRFGFSHHPHAAAQARLELDPILLGADARVADDVRLAVSELVTNVVVHTADGGELRAWSPRSDLPLRIEVQDDDPRIPSIPVERLVGGGRGLSIVAAVSARWGVDAVLPGKTVWAEFDRAGSLGVEVGDV